MPTVGSWDATNEAAASIHPHQPPRKQSLLLLFHFHTFVSFRVEGILETHGPAFFPYCPVTNDFLTLIQSSANTRVNGRPPTPGVPFSQSTAPHTPTAAVRVPRSYGSALKGKKISPVSSSLWVLVTPHW